jgi:hypothetical protein
MPALRGPCFYCGNGTSPAFEVGDTPRLRHKFRNSISSADHVYPKSIVDSVLKSAPKTVKWHANNVVLACVACNNYKGQLHPLDWLVIMPNNHNAARLAERLIELGEDMSAVFDAMRRRRK